MKTIRLILVCLLPAFVLPGCNTMEGLGKDVKSLGSKIERTADEKKN